MPVNEALELMKTKSGIHFDSRVIDAFVCYYNTRYNSYQKAAGFLSNNRKLFMTDA
jgi:HD-GYP domain-containing protein (c-di-GMP phosphodiesterase class II)